MNIILLVTLCAAEIASAAVSIVKGADSKEFRKIRFITTGAELIFFLASLLTPEVKLGIRFSGLCFLLIVRAAIAFALFLSDRKKSESKEKKTFGKVNRAICSCIMILFALFPSFIFTG